MALIKCRECNKEISASAPTCPNCGNPNKTPTSLAAGCASVVAVCIFGAIGLSYCGNHSTDTAKDAEPPTLKGSIRTTGYEFFVTNNNDFDWKDCSFAVNYKLFGTDGYTGIIGTIAAHGTGKIKGLSLALDTGERFNPITHKANNVFMQCEVPNGKNSIGWDFTKN